MREPARPSAAFVDLCHTIHPGMITYPGLPGPVINDYLSREASAPHYAAGTTFQIGQISMVANTGTYLDSPSINIDDRADPARPAHTLLLGAGIPIVEHLCGLRELPDEGFRFFAVPAKVRGLGTFPVRAFAILDR